MSIINSLFAIVLLALVGSAKADGIDNPMASAVGTVTFANLPSASSVQVGTVYNVSNVGVNGSLWRSNGTKWGLVNGSTVLMQSSMPWVSLSSGSIAANGALTGITALNSVYPQAWVWLPLHAVSASSAAGWYYATFATTTTGTVFLNQPSSTFPVIWPASPTAVVAGQGSFTGPGGYTTGQLPNVALPANVMGINGRIDVEAYYESTNDGNNKITILEFGATDSNIGPVGQVISVSFAQAQLIIQNAGVANKQTANGGGSGSGPMVFNYQTFLYTIDTTASTTAAMRVKGTDATDNFVLVNFVATLFNDGQ